MSGHDAPEIHHRPLPAQQRFEGLIERVLTSTSEDTGVYEAAVPPTGSIYLNAMTAGQVTFRLSGEQRFKSPSLYIGGQLQREMPLARIETPWRLVGLQFTATGFHRLFHIDAATVTDRVVSVGDLDDRLEQALSRGIQGLQSTAEIGAAMQDALEPWLSSARPEGLADRAARLIESRSGRIEMARVAQALNVSPRQLRRVFGREVGTTPKSYAKTVQLNGIIAVLQAGDGGAVQRIALEHGYYDQAHFVRDFSRLVGNNPGEFMASRDPFLAMFMGRKRRR